MTRRKLQAVTDETPAPLPRSLAEAAELSERSALVMMRAKIGAQIDGGVPPHALAPLARQFHAIDKEIRALDQRIQEEANDDGVAQDEEFDAEAL